MTWLKSCERLCERGWEITRDELGRWQAQPCYCNPYWEKWQYGDTRGNRSRTDSGPERMF